MREHRGSGLNRVTLTIKRRQLSRRDQWAADSSKGGQGVHMASILIVEDDENLRLAAESFLADEGHHTLTATTAEQALALLEGGIEVDLVLVDIALNGDTNAGLTLARRAADIRKNLKVVYTGQRVTDAMRALFVPSSALLPKSFTVDQIRTALFSNFEIRSPGENLA
jgi:DNA-binding NtrC family response regulator